jgi:hypothetical protein
LDRAALVVVTLVGMAVCAAGVGTVAESGRWLSVPGVAGSLLGVAALAVVAARLLGRPLPFIGSDRAAVAAVLAIVVVKVAIAAWFRVATRA